MECEKCHKEARLCNNNGKMLCEECENDSLYDGFNENCLTDLDMETDDII